MSTTLSSSTSLSTRSFTPPSSTVESDEILPATVNPTSWVYSRYCFAPDVPSRKKTCPVPGSHPKETTAFPARENELTPLNSLIDGASASTVENTMAVCLCGLAVPRYPSWHISSPALGVSLPGSQSVFDRSM